MDKVGRRAFLKHQGALATAAALGAASAGTGAGVLRATPAAAADITGTIEDHVVDQGGQVLNAKHPNYGAKGDAVIATGSMTAFSTTLTWPAGGFQSTDVGKLVTVQGAGMGGSVLSTRIVSRSSATQVMLGMAASRSVASAEFAFGTDDTVSIKTLVGAAANGKGTMYFPPGIYMISGASNPDAAVTGGPVIFGNLGNVFGAGGGPGSPAAASTVFLCADATAGIICNGLYHFQGFCCDGNNIAMAPLQNGFLRSGVGDGTSSYTNFIDVWARRSAGNGWAIYACQNNSFHGCGALDNALDGLYMDAGAGGHDFWNFQESNSGRYGIHCDRLFAAPGGYVNYTADNRFFGGSLTTAADGPPGVSKVYLRNAFDWKFLGTRIIGDNLSGPTIDLHQTDVNNYNFGFLDCAISATPTGAKPGRACIQIAGVPVYNNVLTFAKTDGCHFLRGDTSVYIEAVNRPYYLYSGIGWVFDGTTNGPVAANGLPDIDSLLLGRVGPWKPVTVTAPWSGAVSYRTDGYGVVELSGSLTSVTGAGGSIFTLASGFRPGTTIQIPVPLSNGAGTVTVATDGVVSASAPGAGVTLYLDGVSFAVDG